MTNFRKMVNQITFDIPKIQYNDLFQGSTPNYTSSKFIDIRQFNEEVKGKSQKTFTWFRLTKPKYLILNRDLFRNEYDPYYENEFKYKDEPGLEISLLDKELLRKFPKATSPILFIEQAHEYVYDKLRYVKQSQGKGFSICIEVW